MCWDTRHGWKRINMHLRKLNFSIFHLSLRLRSNYTLCTFKIRSTSRKCGVDGICLSVSSDVSHHRIIFCATCNCTFPLEVIIWVSPRQLRSWSWIFSNSRRFLWGNFVILVYWILRPDVLDVVFIFSNSCFVSRIDLIISRVNWILI
jgi:hypothetical protein